MGYITLTVREGRENEFSHQAPCKVINYAKIRTNSTSVHNFIHKKNLWCAMCMCILQVYNLSKAIHFIWMVRYHMNMIHNLKFYISKYWTNSLLNTHLSNQPASYRRNWNRKHNSCYFESKSCLLFHSNEALPITFSIDEHNDLYEHLKIFKKKLSSICDAYIEYKDLWLTYMYRQCVG